MTPAIRLAAERARREFAAMVRRGIKERDLGRVALLIAEEEEPRNDNFNSTAHYIAVLDELGARARAELAKVGDEGRERVEAFNEFMFVTLGFTGNSENYYDPRNSLLPHVIERRTGIPITLSVVYIEVGRRAGLHVEGVGMPGHFIARVHREDNAFASSNSILVDPFNSKIVDADECQRRLDEIYGGQVALGAEHLQSVDARQILFRMLQNLKGIYANANLDRKAIGTVERLLLLAPADEQEHRDYGMLLARIGRWHEAARELRLYLATTQTDEDKEMINAALQRVQAQIANLN